MVESRTKRVDPRALLRAVFESQNSALALTGKLGIGKIGSGQSFIKKSGLMRALVTCAAAIVGLGAFGTIVVKANDDANVFGFIRQNSRVRTAPAPVFFRSAPQPTPTAYYAPQAFFPRGARQADHRSVDTKRNRIVASYAPFAGFFPSDQFNTQPVRRKAAVKNQNRKSYQVSLSAPGRMNSHYVGGRNTYCVRTCDGFYFPLSTSTGSEKGDLAACNRLCPTAKTKLFVGNGSSEIDDARSRENGKTYASLSNAFSYRKSIDKACSCTANGYGLNADYSILRDGTLRVGDVVMTKTGMRIFAGGTYPYRDANFTSIGQSHSLDAATRERLRQVEQASLPGRSGLAAAPLASARNEARELRAASALAKRETAGLPTLTTRYVGPDRASGIVR